MHGGQLVEYKLELSNAAGASIGLLEQGRGHRPDRAHPLQGGRRTAAQRRSHGKRRRVERRQPHDHLGTGEARRRPRAHVTRSSRRWSNEPVAVLAAEEHRHRDRREPARERIPARAHGRERADGRKQRSATNRAPKRTSKSKARRWRSHPTVPTATIGHRITYTLTVTLPAHVVAYNETVIDTLPDSLDFDEYVGAECKSGCPPKWKSTPTSREITAGSTTRRVVSRATSTTPPHRAR